MPRNGSGVYIPAPGNPVASAEPIYAAWANTTVTDLANELSNSLARDGQAPMTGKLKLAEGAVNAPCLTFNQDTLTGFYQPASSQLALVVAASPIVSLTSTTAALNANTTVSGSLAVTGSTSVNSLAITGTATAPTVATETNDTQVATTAFVHAVMGTASSGTVILDSGTF